MWVFQCRRLMYCSMMLVANQVKIFKEALTETLTMIYQLKSRKSATSGNKVWVDVLKMLLIMSWRSQCKPYEPWTQWARQLIHRGPASSLSCTLSLSGSVYSESPSALSQSTLQCVVVVLKALQFEEVLGTFTLLTGGEVCHLDGSWGDFRGLS